MYKRYRIYMSIILRKEVIQPLVLQRLPCYDLVHLIGFTFSRAILTVKSRISGAPNSGGLTGGVYKAQGRIHRRMLTGDY